VIQCTHQIERATWVPCHEDDWGTHIEGHYEYTTEHTTEDIDIGRFRCTQCGEVMYYTGSWRKFHEEGVPCPGSDLAKKWGILK